ncbi:MAG: hypothetical protein MJA29_02785, partial [Candidatus Omnitrophica bacterium]|nr:hypothetical protein [Candidatus Omnitrophota bacterium]
MAQSQKPIFCFHSRLGDHNNPKVGQALKISTTPSTPTTPVFNIEVDPSKGGTEDLNSITFNQPAHTLGQVVQKTLAKGISSLMDIKILNIYFYVT